MVKLIIAAIFVCFAGCGVSVAADLPTVRIDGPINPVVADFVVEQLQRANEADAPAFLAEIDTPGGLDSAMREMIRAFLSSQVPVIVYVAPSGARAASAGALLTLAADFAAMAPGTNIGAATPVSIGVGAGMDDTMKRKVVNDAVAYARSIAEQRGRNADWAERIVRDGASTAASEALSLKVVDLLAESRAELLKQLDGKRYLRNGRDMRLSLAGSVPVVVEMGWARRILNAVSDPTIAYLLLMLGIIGIFFEISQPGVILPGVVGVLAILLALFAFQALPVNYVGVLLILLGLVLFILEIKVTSYGMLSIGGVIALTLGSLMLIDSADPVLRISLAVIVATVASCTGFILFCLWFVTRSQRRAVVSGREGMVGERGRAISMVHADGRVFVHGEYWDAWADEPVAQGADVEVVAVGEPMRLKVRKTPEENP
ncbi:MAG: nodulation protein NfeD [Deltaproteobacteria bacterium]|nr:MAG: nodulation protein NfeD [Deltaproteobacteria bacterium]